MSETTTDHVRALVDVDEPDYPRLAERLGPDALGPLADLAAGPDPGLASKAVYLASVIGGDGAAPVVRDAAAHADPVIRMAAASGLGNLAHEHASPIAADLLFDGDMAVRKVALRGLAETGSPEIAEKIRGVAAGDPEPALRDLADRIAPAEPPS